MEMEIPLFENADQWRKKNESKYEVNHGMKMQIHDSVFALKSGEKKTKSKRNPFISPYETVNVNCVRLSTRKIGEQKIPPQTQTV